ncbi:hypothetical protein N9F34_05500, partial [Alphaproteobacteria bacterium]|nr:hypothetical protein [Alphaproteobacteria bacterium]
MRDGKFGLVIQGPIVSRDFDCRENLHRLVDEFSGSFEAIVLSTWGGQPDPCLTHPKVFSIFGPDTITGLDRTGRPLYNGPRKHVSSHRGVRYLKEHSDVDFVLVVRTDIYADLSIIPPLIRAYTEKHSDYERVQQKSFIHFLNMSLILPYFATDFFIAGHVDDIDRFFTATVTHLDIKFRANGLIDVDWLIKYMYEHVQKYFDYPEYFNFPVVNKNGLLIDGVFGVYPTKFIDYWQDLTRYVLAPMPREFASTLVWRTKVPYRNEVKFTGAFNEIIWLEDWDNVREDWLGSCRRVGISLYDYDDGGRDYDH